MLHKIIFFICFLSSSFNICIGQQPKLMLPMGHTSYVHSASFSPDGKYIVTASADNTAKVWNTVNGKMVLNLKEHTKGVYSASFSPDGKYIVTASNDNTAKVWNAISGQLLTDLKGHTNGVSSASFSPDGKYIVTYGDYEAKVWNSKSGQMVSDLKGHRGWIRNTSFSPDGKYIVTASDDITAKVWNTISGQLLTNLKGHTKRVFHASFSPDGKYIVTASDDNTAKVWNAISGLLLTDLKGHTKEVYSASFSPDGKYIVTASKDNTAKVWNAISGLLLTDLKGHTERVNSASFSPDGKYIVTASDDTTAKVWNAVSGQMLTNLKGHTEWVKSASFSPDGKYIITASWGNIAKVWNAVSGKLLTDLKGHTNEVSRASFSPDGKYIVTSSWGNIANVWNAVSGKLLTDLKGHTKEVSSASFSPDGKYIVTASMDNTAKVWNTISGQLLTDLKGHTKEVYSASFSPDGKYIVTASKDNTAKVWNAISGLLLTDLKGHISFVNSASFSPDGKYIVTASGDTTAKVWNAAGGQMLTNLKGHTKWVMSASFSPDGKYIVTASDDNTAKVWNAISGQLVTDLKGHTSIVRSTSFSPDGKYIVTASWDNTAKVWNTVSGKLLTNLEGHTGYVTSASFSPDGKYIVTASWDDNIAKVWNTVNGELLTNLEGHTGYVTSASFSPYGKYIVTTSIDNTTMVWKAVNGKILYSFFTVDSNDYLIIDGQNHYDGTEAVRKLLYFTCGTEVIELDQVKDQLWVPNLAERIMKGETINAKTLDELNICGLTPEVEDASSRPDEYYFKIKPRRGGMGETVLLVNGIEARRYKSSELKKNGEFYDLIINKADLKILFIEGKENPVTVKAYTSDNAISSRGVILLEDRTKEASIPPNLYAVMIGVSEYKGDELDLKYAAKDAGDISNAVSNAAKKLLNNDGKEHVFMYNLTTDQEHYLLPEKNSIKKVLEEIGKKATANDILLIFFAGHGVMETEKKQFYFLTADASKASAVSAIADVGISTAELTEWMKPQNIKAQKRILIFDACNSGQAIKDFVQLGSSDQNYMVARNEDKARQIKAIDKLNEHSGLFILSASASNQSAYEMGRYSQGLLTYSLLKAIKERPDILESGKYLDVSRWFVAAKETVSEIAKESGARQDPQIVSNTNFNIGIVDNEVMAKIVLPFAKPLFAASNFQNSDEAIADDDLELSKQINLHLNDLAARGTDSKIVYVIATNSPDAYSLSGRYTITGNAITVSVNIKQNKVIKTKFELSGTKDKLNELAAAVAEKAAGMVK